MLRHKNIERVCWAVVALTLLLACLYVGAATGGQIAADHTMGYEERLFDTSRVHTIDIRMDNWDAFLSAAPQEEYAVCEMTIDGEKYTNVGIRGKGNISLLTVQQYNSTRYSFKVEFDHYQTGNTYHGLDKMSLNNLIQDNTCMKDYLSYTMLNRMGVAAPLCSYVSITVNGENWGMYLAVEGVEESFMKRCFDSDRGKLYKPDSMAMGVGRGNGAEFSIDEFMQTFNFLPQADGEDAMQPFNDGIDQTGTDDVKLKYVGDMLDDYANVFTTAKTDITEADQRRLVACLHALSLGDLSVIDMEAMIRFMAVHNFLCNYDSYTGYMVHNYYLHELNGLLTMIPWDYNLAFGSFQSTSATGEVNAPVDSPVVQGDINDLLLISWIFNNQEYLDAYHNFYQLFLDDVFDSGWFEEEFNRVYSMITPFVQSDPSIFCTYEQFEKGVATLRTFCLKRAQSVAGQLRGEIPSTREGQMGATNLIDASELNIDDMGSLGTMGAMGTGMPVPEEEGPMEPLSPNVLGAMLGEPPQLGGDGLLQPPDEPPVGTETPMEMPQGMMPMATDEPQPETEETMPMDHTPYGWVGIMALMLLAAVVLAARYKNCR